MQSKLFASFLPVLAVAFAGPAAGARHSHDPWLEGGKPVGTSWTATGQFNKLEAVGPDDFGFATGSQWRVRAEGDPRAVAALRYRVDKGRLVVGRDPESDEDIGKAIVHVTAPGISRAGLAGSGSLRVEALKGGEVGASLAGSGRVQVGAIAARKMNGSVAGSGGLTLAGRSAEARFNVAGSGRVDGRTFATGAANASLAGSGQVEFRASGAVRANIVGSGKIDVRGTTDCKQTIAGSGRLYCVR